MDQARATGLRPSCIVGNRSLSCLISSIIWIRDDTAIDGRVSISRKVGARFTAFDGGLSGRTLLIVPNRMIVQSWRAETWKKSDPDSLLILLFSKVNGGGQIELIQANVPGHTHALIKKGWPTHYWARWKRYLKSRRSR